MKTFDSRINQLLRNELDSQKSPIQIIGTTAPSVIAKLFRTLSLKEFQRFSHVVIFPDSNSVADFVDDLEFFGHEKNVYEIGSFDISPYSGLYPNIRSISDRLRALYGFRNAKGGEIFVGNLQAFLQKTIPLDIYKSLSFSLSPGDELPDRIGRMLSDMGYFASPQVEDVGQFALRGGILDVFPPTTNQPVRIELFGDTVDSIRIFHAETQRSTDVTNSIDIIPCREITMNDDSRALASQRLRQDFKNRKIPSSQVEGILHDVYLGKFFHGIDYLISDFYETPSQPLDFLKNPYLIWTIDPIEIERTNEQFFKNLEDERTTSFSVSLHPKIGDLYESKENLNTKKSTKEFQFSKVHVGTDEEQLVNYKSVAIKPFETNEKGELNDLSRLKEWVHQDETVIISAHTDSQAQRLKSFLNVRDIPSSILDGKNSDWLWSLDSEESSIYIIPRPLSESVRIPQENLTFIREEDFFGKKKRSVRRSQTSELTTQSENLSFAELNPGDRVVHIDHGVGVYEGLKIMSLAGSESEFLQIKYRDDDKLYLPVYRIGQLQKFSGAVTLDKLGGTQWEKTKVKVKAHLRDIANDLLELYAKRKSVTREPYPEPNEEFREFEAYFPYDETNDQLKAINDIMVDMSKQEPMDRLICGDVGFGKTEVALRAAFRAVQAGRQVAILVPTTILAFQHQETFDKRFSKWPIEIRNLSRFTSTKNAKDTIQKLKEGKVDIVIGTHRLLSKDLQFKNLGLLIIDEEQRFGVSQKEKLRRLKAEADTISMSATPIPRTLNMSFMGIRDLSLINTPPQDRLPTRTFLCKFDPETLKKAITSEIQRGGQIYYVHNRVRSIYEEATQLKEIVPDARIIVAHGQMGEKELEKAMLAFYNHEFDILVCTTIIESGIDISRANTMIVDRADQYGLSQLYQLRGRIGRSNERAYCYLLLPKSGLLDPLAQDRLKILQEYSDLGAGIHIAQHDLELRGAGNLLGDAQSGHIEAVGYELYLELLDEAIRHARGEPTDDHIEPDINIQIRALIPDQYMPDVRVRLAYYRRLSKIRAVEEIDKIEDDMRDQFGKPPDEVMNLFGVMVIRFFCRELGIRDLSTGPKNLSLTFSEKTRVAPEKVIELTMQNTKKYQLAPDNRLIVRLDTSEWTAIYEELIHLQSLK